MEFRDPQSLLQCLCFAQMLQQRARESIVKNWQHWPDGHNLASVGGLIGCSIKVF